MISLAGDDHRIVRYCDAGSQSGFFFTGLFIPLIFLVCLASSYITFREVFDNMLLGFILSLFFAWMITNLYRLLLYTFSANPLPQVNKKAGKFFSGAIRLGFVCFIAVMIAKPLEAVMYSGALDKDIAAYKARAKQASHYKIVLYYQKQIDEIIHLSENTKSGERFVQDKMRARRQDILRANALIDASGFFLQRLRFLSVNHPSCWWITAFFLLVFLYPLALRQQLKHSSYYLLKASCDRRKIDLNYYAFRRKYTALFEKFHDRRVIHKEYYEDPPYNTVRKQDTRRILTEKEFISNLYHV